MTDGRVPYELRDGESYRGLLYDGYYTDKSDKAVEFVYTKVMWEIFRANELKELAVDCIFHSRLSNT